MFKDHITHSEVGQSFRHHQRTYGRDLIGKENDGQVAGKADGNEYGVVLHGRLVSGPKTPYNEEESQYCKGHVAEDVPGYIRRQLTPVVLRHEDEANSESYEGVDDESLGLTPLSADVAVVIVIEQVEDGHRDGCYHLAIGEGFYIGDKAVFRKMSDDPRYEVEAVSQSEEEGHGPKNLCILNFYCE